MRWPGCLDGWAGGPRAGRAVGEAGRRAPPTARALRLALADPDPQVRSAALEALGKAGRGDEPVAADGTVLLEVHAAGVGFVEQLDLVALEEGVEVIDVGLFEVELRNGRGDLVEGQRAGRLTARDEGLDLFELLEVGDGHAWRCCSAGGGENGRALRSLPTVGG